MMIPLFLFGFILLYWPVFEHLLDLRKTFVNDFSFTDR